MQNQKTQDDNDGKLEELTENLRRLRNIKEDLQRKIDAKCEFKALKLVSEE